MKIMPAVITETTFGAIYKERVNQGGNIMRVFRTIAAEA